MTSGFGSRCGVDADEETHQLSGSLVAASGPRMFRGNGGAVVLNCTLAFDNAASQGPLSIPAIVFARLLNTFVEEPHIKLPFAACQVLIGAYTEPSAVRQCRPARLAAPFRTPSVWKRLEMPHRQTA